MYALVNCKIYTGRRVEHDKAVVIDGKRIHALVSPGELGDAIDRIDLGGLSVAPGFIDIQVNGGGGVLFNDSPTIDGIRSIADAHRKFGTTNLLPTYITGPRDGMASAVDAVRQAIACGEPNGILGIHLEGPFINPAKAGVHDQRYVRQPTEEDLNVVMSLPEGVTLLTLAPEVVTEGVFDKLLSSGVRISLGHTAASCEEALAALNRGASCVTHLYNAMSALTSRAPGVVGAALHHPSSWAGIIVDGYHSDFVAAGVAIRAKAARKMLLVTDAMPPVGSRDPGSGYRLGEYDVYVEDGRCVTSTGVLAGSALDMATAVRNCVQELGLPKDEALRMASTYPAEFLGLEDELGLVSAGHRANLVIFDEQIRVSATVVDGEHQAQV